VLGLGIVLEDAVLGPEGEAGVDGIGLGDAGEGAGDLVPDGLVLLLLLDGQFAGEFLVGLLEAGDVVEGGLLLAPEFLDEFGESPFVLLAGLEGLAEVFYFELVLGPVLLVGDAHVAGLRLQFVDAFLVVVDDHFALLQVALQVLRFLQQGLAEMLLLGGFSLKDLQLPQEGFALPVDFLV
jgi:hypothetical protein